MPDYEQNKRLKYLIENVFKISPVEFSKRYEDTKAVKTYNIISCRNGISNNMLVQILSAYPQINRVWLLTGEGEPLNDNLPTISKSKLVEIGSEVFKDKIIKLYESGDFVPAQVVSEKEAEIEKLNRLIGKLEAKIEELSLKKGDAHPEDNADYADAK